MCRCIKCGNSDRSQMCAYFKQLVMVIMRGDGEVMVTCCVVLLLYV